MIVRIVQFRRASSSPYERGLKLETDSLEVSDKLFDVNGVEMNMVHDIVDSITCIDFSPILNQKCPLP